MNPKFIVVRFFQNRNFTCSTLLTVCRSQELRRPLDCFQLLSDLRATFITEMLRELLWTKTVTTDTPLQFLLTWPLIETFQVQVFVALESKMKSSAEKVSAASLAFDRHPSLCCTAVQGNSDFLVFSPSKLQTSLILRCLTNACQ